MQNKPLHAITALGAGDRITKAMMSDDFEYPVMGGGIVPTGYYTKWNRENCITISRAGSAGSIDGHPEKFWATDVCFVAAEKNESNAPNIKFIYYAMKAQETELRKHIYGGSMPKINKAYLWNLSIPVPPLPVQCEIVRILDTFTELTEELTARRKQYEYYREFILSQCSNKVTNIVWDLTNKEYQYIDLTAVDREMHVVTETQGINKKTAPFRARQIVNEYDVLLGTTRPMLKRYCMIDKRYDNQICSTGFCVLRAKKNVVLPRWIYHQIASLNFFAYVDAHQKGAGYPSITDSAVKNYPIPIPTLSEQQHIISILDRFEALCSDITQGIPAEIEARKKQYEYYRDKLLAFKQKEVVSA